MRCCWIVLVLSAAVLGDEAARWVSQLDHENPSIRRRVGIRLLDLGPKAWPELAHALRHSNAARAAAAATILRRGGWIDPAWSDVLTADDVARLRGKNPTLRTKTAAEVARRGPRGRAALAALYATGHAALEVMEPDRVMHGSMGSGRLKYRVRNGGARAGWYRHATLTSRVTWAPFGHRVSFPVRPTGRRVSSRFLIGRRFRTRYVNTSGEAEWLEPGEVSQQGLELTPNFKRPGAYVIRPSWGMQSSTVKLVSEAADGSGIPLTELDVAAWPLPRPRLIRAFVLPPSLLWGKDNYGVELNVKHSDRGWLLELNGMSDMTVPPDLSSGWFAVLDDWNRVLAHGPLDGKARGSRTYRKAGLVPAVGSKFLADKLGAWPAGATGILFAIRCNNGRSRYGRTVISRRIRLLDTIRGR